MEHKDIKRLIDASTEVFKLIHQLSYRNLDQLRLYPGQPKLLAIIREQEGITQKELSEKNFVKPATITGMLNKLEANQYVYRLPDKTDKRIMRVYLTPEGRRIAELGEKFLTSLTEKMFQDFSMEELGHYLYFMDKIRNNLKNE